jgi:hypothetical protein
VLCVIRKLVWDVKNVDSEFSLVGFDDGGQPEHRGQQGHTRCYPIATSGARTRDFRTWSHKTVCWVMNFYISTLGNPWPESCQRNLGGDDERRFKYHSLCRGLI